MLILGCKLDDIGPEEAAGRIVALARQAHAVQIVTLGTEMVVYAQRDTRFRDIVNASALSLCDTVGVLWLARRCGAKLRERVTGVDLIERVCARAADEGVGLYFLGGAEGVARDAARALQARHPRLIVSGVRNGYFDDVSSEAIASEIRATGARLLLCGLGFPRQEYWLSRHLHDTGCGAGIGVGGSFDVMSGRLRRAPASWQRLHLEWLYRLVTEPRRWRRQLALPLFIALAARDALRIRGARS